MIELTQTRRQALLSRLYWRSPDRVDYETCASCGGTGAAVATTDYTVWAYQICELCEGTGTIPVWEMRPRRFGWLLRPLMGFEPFESPLS